MRHIFTSLLLVASVSLSAQEIINWYTWEEGMTKSEDEPKKFIVDMYTDWCGWCKRMDKATFQNNDIATYVNENYIAIKFDAEQKGELSYQENVYKFVKSGRRGYHQLAAQLTGGKLSYPTVIFLDEKKEVIQALPGFLDAQTFAPIIKYFAEDEHQTTPWAVYLSNYKAAQGVVTPPVTPKKNNHTRLVKGNR